jgi:hypothetical protein
MPGMLDFDDTILIGSTRLCRRSSAILARHPQIDTGLWRTHTRFVWRSIILTVEVLYPVEFIVCQLLQYAREKGCCPLKV